MLLVLTPAPKERRQEMNGPVEHWTKTFLASGAPRTRVGLLPHLWLLVVCTVIFPVAVWSRSEVAKDAAKVHDTPDTRPEVRKDVDFNAVKTSSTEAVANVAVTKAAVNTAAVAAQPQQPVSTTEQTDAAAVPPTGTANPAITPESAALPNIPSPDLGISATVPIAASPAIAMRTLKLRAFDSGQERTGTVDVPVGATVAQALLGLGITVNQFDRVTPLANTKAYDGIAVRITRVRTESQARTITVEPETRYQLDPKLAAGRQEIVQQSVPGIIEVSERLWFKDGKLSMREELGRKVKQQAKDKVVALGVRSYYMPGKVPYHKRYARAFQTYRGGSPRDRMKHDKPVVAPVEGSKTLRPVRSITLTATGYSPDPRENGGYTVTATGLPIGYGAAAVDPRVIPLGTKMYVEGYGYAFACDTGGAIKGNRIDLAYDSYRYANTKGRKKVKVWILGE